MKIYRVHFTRPALLGLVNLSLWVGPLSAATVSWVGASGDWNTPANWSTGALPGTNDDAVINTGPAITVTHSTGTHTIRSLQSQQAFTLSGGSLTVSNTVQVNSTFLLSGGTLVSATVLAGTNGAGLIVKNSGAVLNRVRLNAGLDVGNTYSSAILSVANGLELNGTAQIGNTTNSNWGQVRFSGSQTLNGTGSVVFGGANPNELFVSPSGGGLVIGPGITVTGQNGALTGTGTFWYLNQGTIASVGGGSLTISGTWTNTGTINVTNGALTMDGTFSLASLGQFNRSGGAVYVTGTLNNTNTTVPLNALGGSWILNNGTVNGGTIIATNGTALFVQNNNSALNGVTVNGTLDVGNAYSAATLAVANGLVLNGTALVGNPTNSNWGQLRFSGAQTLGGTGTVIFGQANPNEFFVNGGGGLVIGPGITLTGLNGALTGGGSYWYVNQGTINCLSGASFEVSGTWTNAGSINETNGALTLDGTFTLASLGQFKRSGGSVYLTGTLNNTNTTVSLDALGGSWILNNGTINGGTIIAANGTKLLAQNSASALNGVTLNGTLDVGNTYSGAVVTVANGLVLNGTALVGNPTNSSWGQLRFSGMQTLSGNATVIFGDANPNEFYINNSGGLTIGAGIRLTGLNGALTGGGNFWYVNQGTIAALAGAAFQLSGTWTNLGTINQTNAAVSLDGTFTLASLGQFNRNGGTVYLTGTLNNTNTIVSLNALGGSWMLNNGTINGGTIVGTNGVALIVGSGSPLLNGVTVNGTLDIGNADNGATLVIETGLTLNGTALVGSATNGNWGEIHFSGTQTLGGNGTVVFGQAAVNRFYAESGTGVTLGPGIAIMGTMATLMGAANSSYLNQGTISANVSGGALTVNGPLATNTGHMYISAGASLNWSAELRIDPSQIVTLQPGANLALSGSLLGAPASAVQFNPQGAVSFNAGTNRLEAMSRDLGNAANGYLNNFAYGGIAIGSGARVTLVNLSTNSTGPLPECVYANSLSVAAGATLDLNGLRLYTRLSQISGNVVGGSLIQAPNGGGALTLGTGFGGSLTNAGSLAAWTFFGRAGESVKVVVSTGGADVLAPPLNYAFVQLFDPLTNTLAQASNTIAAQQVVLPAVTLPADGTYTVLVRAPGNHSTSTGNYLLTVWDATINNRTLVLNQPANGRLATPYTLDQWSFTATAGQQVQFQLLNVSAPGIGFDLIGPGGWIGFSNLIASSGLVTLPASGNYLLTAHNTGGAYGMSYAFGLQQTAQASLAPGNDYLGQFISSGQAQLLVLTVTNHNPLLLTLTNSGAHNIAELYVKLGSPPTRADFDYASVVPHSASQQILIQSPVPGTYYVLVFGDLIVTPGEFTLSARSFPLLLSALAPTSYGAGTVVSMTISGAGFDNSAQANLVSSNGSSVYPALSTTADSFTQLTALFSLTNVPQGLYSVAVTEAASSQTLTNAFTVLPNGAAQLETQLILPGALGWHAPATLYVEYANTGTAAMPAPLLVLQNADTNGVNQPVLTLDASRLVQSFHSAVLPPGTANKVFILASGAQPGVLDPGERIRVPVYYQGIQQPWDFTQHTRRFEMRYWTADDPTPIDWSAREELLRPPTLSSNVWEVVFAALTTGLTNSGAYVRMLDDNAQYLGRLGQRVVDVDALWNFAVQQVNGFVRFPALDATLDASMSAPGLPLNFAREFPATVSARNSFGLFGFGWFSPWMERLSIESGSGLVRLLDVGGAAWVYTRDGRNGNYFSGPGDNRTLSAVGDGSYNLASPHGTVTHFRTDGLIDFVRDRNGNTILVGYDANGKVLSLSHSSGALLTLTYNSAGLVSAITDSAGRIVSYTYDASNTRLLTVSSPDGKVTSYTYQLAGTVAQQNALIAVSREGTTRHFVFDAQGRPAMTYLATGEQQIAFNFGPQGRVTITDTLGTWTLAYDTHGLLARVTDPLGNSTTAGFDDDFHVTSLVHPDGTGMHFTWCGCGGLTSLTDELGAQASFQRNNPYRNVTSFTDQRGNSTTFDYDATGNLLGTRYPDDSVESITGYTSDGLAQSSINRRGQQVAYCYNSAGQLTCKRFDNGSYATFIYDARGNLLAATNHLASGTNHATLYSYNYAQDGDRLKRVTYPDGRWVAYAYDSFGHREQISDSTGQTNNYIYDSAGRVWQLRDATGTLIVEYLYNGSGRLQRVNKGNGTFSTYEYDAAANLLQLNNYGPAGTTNSFFIYSYDKRGRRTAMATMDGNWTYSYDALSQLAHATFASRNPAIPSQDLQYSYDPAGNRTRTVINGAVTDYTANSQNQYVSFGGIKLQYDADGNLAFDGAQAYSYDAENRLVSVSGPQGLSSYEYDAFGSRTSKTLNGQRTEFLLDPAGLVNVVAETDSTGNVLDQFAYGVGLACQDASFGRSFYEFDAAGSVAGLATSAGVEVNRYAYSPFGGSLERVQTIPNPFGFGGKFGVSTESNGDLAMRARYLAPGLGRFLSIDPIGMTGGLNFYSYCGNQPVSRVDPRGLRSDHDEGVEEACKVGIEGTYGSLFGPGLGFILSGNAALELVVGVLCPECVVAEIIGGIVVGGTLAGSMAGALIAPSICGPPPPGSGPSGGGGGGDSGDSGASGVATSTDPNELIGPAGYAVQNFVVDGNLFTYQIVFQNETNATAPAQAVQITDPLSTNLDWSTFALSEIAFGDNYLVMPAGAQYFRTNLPVTINGSSFQLQIEAGIQFATGQVFANFYSLDPLSGLPPSVDVGFLPPEDGTGKGTGHVNYSIRPMPNLPTGTIITNVAFIQFDENPIVATDQADPHDPSKGIDTNKLALITIDSSAPVSQVNALPAFETNSTFTVCWSGADLGSGVTSYDLYVSTNGGPWALWLGNTTNSCADFTGQKDVTYAFYSVAHDGAGNAEAAPTIPGARTAVLGSPVIVASKLLADGRFHLTAMAALGQSYTLLASTNLVDWTGIAGFISTNLPMTLVDPAATNFARRFYRIGPLAIRLALDAAHPLDANGANLLLLAQPGLSYRVEASSDALHWSALTSFTSADSVFSFRDPFATNYNQRFYRAVTP
jgi:RHS repeat-associated protein